MELVRPEIIIEIMIDPVGEGSLISLEFRPFTKAIHFHRSLSPLSVSNRTIPSEHHHFPCESRPSVLRRRVFRTTWGTNINAKHSVPIPASKCDKFRLVTPIPKFENHMPSAQTYPEMEVSSNAGTPPPSHHGFE